MSWYDIKRWENTIREHSRYNTSKGLIRELVRYCAMCEETTLEYDINNCMHYVDGYIDEYPRGNVKRIMVFVHCLVMFIQNDYYVSYDVYEKLYTILTKLHMDEAYRGIVEGFTKTCVKDWLKRNVPVWYATALKNGKMTPFPKDEYDHAHYDADVESFKILRGMDVFDDFQVLLFTSFEDEVEYQKLFHEIFVDGRRSSDDIRKFIREVNINNIPHIRTEEWMILAVQMGYDTLEAFVLNSGMRASTFIRSNVPLDEVLRVIDIARTEYYTDDERTIYIEDATETGEEPIVRRRENPFVFPEGPVFYNTREIARSLSQRPDITYDIYENVLRETVWWTEPPTEIYPVRHHCHIPMTPLGRVDAMFLGGIMTSPYEHIFRDFMDNKNKFREILDPEYHRRYDDVGWEWFSSAISRNTYLTIDDVKDLPEIHWDWESLSSNESIATPENILSNMSLPWVWGRWGISASPGITPEFVKEHWEKGINFGDRTTDHEGEDSCTLSSNHTVVTPDLINHFPDKSWNYGYSNLSQNCNLTTPWLLTHLSDRKWDIAMVIMHVKPDNILAIKAIQSWWRILTAKRRCARVAAEVEEWWYNPDCKPAARIREDMIWRNHRTTFDE